jgi:tetratricopeptide (TPR) repeat protein
MKLSVCCIARDEEQNLARALASIAGIADEIVVIDTGSKDSTVEIARKFGARVRHFQWCDDFSAARNFALDQARSQWILWMDADEELCASSVEEVRRSLQSDRSLAYYVLHQDLAIPGRLDLYTEMWHLRLFRNDRALRFQGRCHPFFCPPAEEIAKSKNLQIEVSRIALRHYGYLPDARTRKLERGQRLLDLELRDRPGQFYYLVEYGRTLLALGKTEKGRALMAEAAEQLLTHLNEPTPYSSMIAPLLEYLLEQPEEQLPCGLSNCLLIDLSEKWFPRAAPLLWIKAKREFEKGAFEKAEQLLRSLLEMGRNHSYDRSISFNPAIVGEDAMLNLGASIFRQGKLGEAEKCFKSLLASETRRREAMANLQEIENLRKKRGPRPQPNDR